MPIYLDNAATTAVDPLVAEEMGPYMVQKYGNPATRYSLGIEACEAVLIARERVANLLKCSPQEVYFTSGGTESDNLALIGTYLANKRKKHIISSRIEHHAILHTLDFLYKHFGVDYDLLPVDSVGRVNPEDLRRLIREDTLLVSVMSSNNEIGTIQPIAQLAEIAKSRNCLFHTDAVQTAGKIPIDVNSLGIDLLSLSAHKFHGPKGIGAIFVRNETKIEHLLSGGGQELGLRSGTSNVPGIVGLGKACQLAEEAMDEGHHTRDKLLFDLFRMELSSRIPRAKINGPQGYEQRILSNINICVPGIDSSEILDQLESKGICAAAGSACNCDDPSPSHVLTAIGLSDDEALSSLRFSFSKYTDESDLLTTINALSSIISR